MTTPAHPGRMLFVTLPVEDPARSQAFFEGLGFAFNPAFSDGDGVCMLVGEQAFVMLVKREKWQQFSKLPLADPRTHAVGLFCFSVDERGAVDTVTDAAVAAGAVDHDDAEDHGFMYTRSFFDLDGHGWQVMWMDPVQAEAGAPA
jgi:uncharacterized protein